MRLNGSHDRYLQQYFCEYRPKRSSVADTATEIGTFKLEENDVIVFQIYLGQFSRSTCIFKDNFEEIEILNDTKKRLSEQNWVLWDHQPIVRNDFEDVSRLKITR